MPLVAIIGTNLDEGVHPRTQMREVLDWSETIASVVCSTADGINPLVFPFSRE